MNAAQNSPLDKNIADVTSGFRFNSGSQFFPRHLNVSSIHRHYDDDGGGVIRDGIRWAFAKASPNRH